MRYITVLFLFISLGCSAMCRSVSSEPLQGPRLYDPVYILRNELANLERDDPQLKLMGCDTTVQFVAGNSNLSRLPALLQARAFDEALCCINSVAESCESPVASDLHLWCGAIFYSKGEYRRALESIEKSIRLSPGSWRAYFHQYHMLVHLNKDLDAEVARRKVLQLNPAAPVSDYHSKATEGVVI